MRAEAAGLPRCTVIFFGNDDLIQYPGCAVFPRLRAAAAAAGKQGVRRDDDGCVRDIPVFLGNRKHLGLRQRYLPGKDLDAPQCARCGSRALRRSG